MRDEGNAISQCPKCGTKMPASRPSDRCPVCQLRGALDAGTDLGPGDASMATVEFPSGLTKMQFRPADLITTSC